MSKPRGYKPEMTPKERLAWRDGFAAAMRIVHAGVILRGDDDLATRISRLTIPRASWTGVSWPPPPRRRGKTKRRAP